MVTLLDLFSENDQIKKWHQNLTDKKRQLILGLSTSTKALAIASSLEKEDRIVLLTSTYGEAEGLVSDLISILGEELVYPFLVDDAPMVEFLMSSQEKIISRVEALRFLTDSSKKGILVCNIAASRLILPSPNAFKDSIVKISVGEEYDQHAFIHQLKENGYRKVTQVQTQGEFSLRGDILDIFEISQLEPCRIEFFGDEIDGIRSFEVETQLSKENKTELTIFPASDMLLREKDYQRGQSALEKQISKTLSPILKSYLEEILSSFHQKQSHADSRKFLSLCYDKTWTVFDYIEKDTPIFFDDYQKLMNQYEVFERDLAQYFTEELQNSKAFSDMQYFSDIEQIYKKQSPVTFFSNLQKGLGNLKFDKIYQFNQYPMQEFFNQFSFLKEEIERYKKMDYTIILQSSNSMGSKTLEDMLEEYQIKLDSRDKTSICKESVNLIEGNLRHGFHFVDEKILLITEHEIFQKKLKRRFRRQHVSNAERLKDYNELEKGDYVVHHIHGIGQYLGIETIEIKGIHRDYVSVQYQNGDQISIPVEQIHLLSKYISSDGKAPKLNKLNDGHFKKAKQKVKNQVEDIADDLIKLYSERSQLKGFAFSADDDDQDAFDDAFPYVETDDQLRSIEEIKRDMQASQPMDRLLVGDVGFELYSQLLEEAIAKRNGNANANTRTKGNAELILQIDAYLPDTYISDQRHKIEIYKKIRQIDNRVNYEELQEELIDRFGEYPDVVAYLLEIGLVKSYLDKVFVQRVERKDNKITIQFEKVTQRLFLAQDYFKALSVTNLKAGIAENKGLMELVFDVQNKKDYEILEGLLIFGESLLEIKEFKEENSI